MEVRPWFASLKANPPGMNLAGAVAYCSSFKSARGEDTGKRRRKPVVKTATFFSGCTTDRDAVGHRIRDRFLKPGHRTYISECSNRYRRSRVRPYRRKSCHRTQGHNRRNRIPNRRRSMNRQEDLRRVRTRHRRIRHNRSLHHSRSHRNLRRGRL
jgi:hypothetical protein